MGPKASDFDTMSFLLMCGLLALATGVVRSAAAGTATAQSAGAATSEGLGQPTPTRSRGGQRQNSCASASSARLRAAVIWELRADAPPVASELGAA